MGRKRTRVAAIAQELKEALNQLTPGELEELTGGTVETEGIFESAQAIQSLVRTNGRQTNGGSFGQIMVVLDENGTALLPVQSSAGDSGGRNERLKSRVGAPSTSDKTACNSVERPTRLAAAREATLAYERLPDAAKAEVRRKLFGDKAESNELIGRLAGLAYLRLSIEQAFHQRSLDLISLISNGRTDGQLLESELSELRSKLNRVTAKPRNRERDAFIVERKRAGITWGRIAKLVDLHPNFVRKGKKTTVDSVKKAYKREMDRADKGEPSQTESDRLVFVVSKDEARRAIARYDVLGFVRIPQLRRNGLLTDADMEHISSRDNRTKMELERCVGSTAETYDDLLRAFLVHFRKLAANYSGKPLVTSPSPESLSGLALERAVRAAQEERDKSKRT